jgi:hypothetical protein
MADYNVIALGREAERLLRDPALLEGFDRAHNLIIAEWSATEPREAARREDLHAELRALRRLKGRLHAMATDGRQASDRRAS